MRRRLLAAALVIAVLLALPFAAESAGAADGPMATVKGHVLTASGRGISGVVVKVAGQKWMSSQSQSATARTSATGHFSVRVPWTTGEYSSYRLLVSDPGRTNRVVTDGRWAPLRMKVHDAARVVVVNPRLTLGAGLSGRLTDALGRPVRSGLAVTATTYSVASGRPKYGGVAYTTAGGRYRFTNLPPGPTSLCFQAIAATTYARCYTGRLRGGLFPTDYRLRLISGHALTGIDLRYPKVTGGISGRALVDGERIDSDEHFAIVELLDSSGKQLDSCETDDEFAFRELDAGTYFLRIHGGGDLGEEVGTEFYRDAETLATATPIRVGSGRAVKGIRLDLTSD